VVAGPGRAHSPDWRQLDQGRGAAARWDDARGRRAAVDRDGGQLGAAWVRTLRSTGQTVYSGWYGTATLPHSSNPSVKVTFPLPNGSLIVFLQPRIGHGGALELTSPLAAFGGDGAYLLVAGTDGRSAWVRRVPLAERFTVYVDAEGVLRTDHAVDLWRIPVIRLHYRLEQRPAPPSTGSPASTRR
jgi:hypothetical protein